MVLVATLVQAVVPAAGTVPSVTAQGSPACFVGEDLVTNGSFESPGLGATTIDGNYRPTGWSGRPEAVSAGSPTLSGRAPVGSVYLRLPNTGVQQLVSTAGLGGAQLRVTFTTYDLNVPAVVFNGLPVTVQLLGTFYASAFIQLPAFVPDSSVIRFVSGGSGLASELDNVRLEVGTCPYDAQPEVTGLDAPYVTTAGTPVSDTFTVSDDYTRPDDLRVTPQQAANGTVTVTGAGATRRVTYQPDPGFTGTDEFAVAVFDGRNTTYGQLSVTVRAAPPVISVAGGPQPGATYSTRDVPARPTCSARDARGATIPCIVTGYSAQVGTHTLTFRAVDDAGTEATLTRTYTVTAPPTPTPRATRTPRTPATATPTPPVTTPTTPVITPTTPAVTPTTPAVTPTTPAVTPTTPAVTPTTRPTRPPRG